MSTLLAYLTYFHSSSLMVNIFFWHYYYFTYFAYAHYYFLLFVFVLQDTWTVSYSWQDVQLSVDVPHPLAYDVSSDVNSPGISHLFSQLIYDGEHLDLTHIFYAHYYLLSVCLLQNVQTVSYSWQDVQQSQALCLCSSPSSWWRLLSCQLSWYTSLFHS